MIAGWAVILAMTASLALAQGGNGAPRRFHDFKLKDIDGRERALSEFAGKLVLVVNVASKCGFTKQYAGLQKLHETYGPQGLVVLGFPSNDFLGQEPGTEAEIKAFCSATYGVTFPLFAKIVVKGEGIEPLYAWLTSKDEHPEYGGPIAWNFNKFLISRDGRVIGRFGSRVAPESDELKAALENALKAP